MGKKLAAHEVFFHLLKIAGDIQVRVAEKRIHIPIAHLHLAKNRILLALEPIILGRGQWQVGH